MNSNRSHLDSEAEQPHSSESSMKSANKVQLKNQHEHGEYCKSNPSASVTCEKKADPIIITTTYKRIFPRYSNSPNYCQGGDDTYSEREASLEDYLFHLSGRDIFTYLQDGIKNYLLSQPNPMTASHLIYEQIHLFEKHNAIQATTQGLPGLGCTLINKTSSLPSDGPETNVNRSSMNRQDSAGSGVNNIPTFLSSILKGEYNHQTNLSARIGNLATTNQGRNSGLNSQSKNYSFPAVNNNFNTESKDFDTSKYRLHFYSYLKVYLRHALEGQHVVGRDYSFICSTMYNRHCFILKLEEKYPSSLQCQVNVTMQDLHALLLQVCPDFPPLASSPVYSKLRLLPNFNHLCNEMEGVSISNGDKQETSLINDDAETSLLTLIRAFYIAFYFQEYLEAVVQIFQKYNSGLMQSKGKHDEWLPAQNTAIITTETLLHHLECLPSNSKVKGEKYLPMDILHSILVTSRCHTHKYTTLKMFIGSILNSSFLAKSLCIPPKAPLFSLSTQKNSNCFFAIGTDESATLSNQYDRSKGNGSNRSDGYEERQNELKESINKKSIELREEQERYQKDYLYNILNFDIDGTTNKSKYITVSKEDLNSCINVDLVNIDIGKYNLVGKKHTSVASTTRRIHFFNNMPSNSTNNAYCNNQGQVSSSGGGGTGSKRRTKRG